MGFEADWLALRAPADQRARDPGLLADAEALIASRSKALVVDLGCGAGASVMAISAPGANWRLVDNDAALIARAEAAAARRGTSAERRVLDLAAPGDGLAEAVSGADLVASSAFLDLVSAAWIDRLVAALPDRAGLYVALSYSGEMRWAPEHPQDEPVRAAFNRHQSGDKGFGPALGPAATGYLAETLEQAGRAPRLAQSDWRLSGERDGALIRELTTGIAGAAREMGIDVEGWLEARRGAREGLVSHLDLYAPPLATPA